MLKIRGYKILSRRSEICKTVVKSLVDLVSDQNEIWSVISISELVEPDSNGGFCFQDIIPAGVEVLEMEEVDLMAMDCENSPAETSDKGKNETSNT